MIEFSRDSCVLIVLQYKSEEYVIEHSRNETLSSIDLPNPGKYFKKVRLSNGLFSLRERFANVSVYIDDYRYDICRGEHRQDFDEFRAESLYESITSMYSHQQRWPSVATLDDHINFNHSTKSTEVYDGLSFTFTDEVLSNTARDYVKFCADRELTTIDTLAINEVKHVFQLMINSVTTRQFKTKLSTSNWNQLKNISIWNEIVKQACDNKSKLPEFYFCFYYTPLCCLCF